MRGDQRGPRARLPDGQPGMAAGTPPMPADGVYAAWLVRRGPAEPLRAAVSVGTNPTFSGRERRVEAYVLDFAGDLYGERLALDFVARLRETRRYDGVEPLVAQIHRRRRAAPARCSAEPPDPHDPQVTSAGSGCGMIDTVR